MKNITLLDGAFGTEIWKLAQESGLNRISTWRYSLEAPQLVQSIHESYVKAGSQISIFRERRRPSLNTRCWSEMETLHSLRSILLPGGTTRSGFRCPMQVFP